MNIKDAFNTFRNFINKFNEPARIIRNVILLVALVAIALAFLKGDGGGLDPKELNVEKIDNGLIRMLNIESKSDKPITVKKITINNDFSPKIDVRPMSMGEGYHLDLNYGTRYTKEIFKVEVETDRGSATYSW